MAELAREAWRQTFAGDYSGVTERPPWTRGSVSRRGAGGISFDSYSSVEYRLEAAERGLEDAQTGLRSVAGEVAGARAEMAALSKKVSRLPGRGFLLLVLLVLMLAAAALVAFAPEIRAAVADLL
ncbi:MAG TPA: hypothetical protein VFZ81_00770 [Burkholderiales bacterium]